MQKNDIPQVSEIDREAFPTQWPHPNYQHEMRNRLAYYNVVCDDEKLVDLPVAQSSGGLTGLVARVRHWFDGDGLSDDEQALSKGHYIVGFVGCWVLADEAHVTSIAVREAYRRQGVGELLIIKAIDLAAEMKASVVTLEVRVSNTVAQNLYIKYGFNEVGVRKGYYIDNREDALLMSTENIRSDSYKARFKELKQAHLNKLGVFPDCNYPAV